LNIGSYFQLALYFTIGILIFTLCVNFVDGMGVFTVEGSPVHIDKGVSVSGNASNIFYQFTGLTGGMEYVWGLGISLAALGSVALAWATKQTIPIGIFVFSSVFWTSWIRCWSIFTGVIPDEFLTIAHVVMLMIFAGAIAGLLSGGG